MIIDRLLNINVSDRLVILQADITKLKVGAIVNAANQELRAGSGVCGAIFKAVEEESDDTLAGDQLRQDCKVLAPLKVGESAITKSYGLPADFIIHAVGPIYEDYSWQPKLAEELLASAYLSALQLANENGCTSIAFPAISTGIYGFPPDRAAMIAVGVCKEWLTNDSFEDVLTRWIVLTAFDQNTLNHLITARKTHGMDHPGVWV